MSDKDVTVQCAQHGKTSATFLCQHVAFGSGQGFVTGTDDPDDAWPDAWCNECDNRLMANGGEWNDEIEALAQVTLLCAGCYEAARERNWKL